MRVRFAKMKLVGLIIKFWHTLNTYLQHINQPPINHWVLMKERLKEKHQ